MCTPTPSSVSVSDLEVEYLDTEDLLDLAGMLLGNPAPIRDLGLLGSAAARPQTTVFGDDAYPDLWKKAAALVQSLVKNHPLVDGNKRLGWLATAVFLELNGIATQLATNDDVYEFVMAVAAGALSIDEIAEALHRLLGGSR
jgi:death-on-curing protein